MQSIAVKHNIEVAHRLFELPGKCEQIHGHSMWVTMHLTGATNDSGILAGIEYGDLKRLFRGYLDETYDHRLLLNVADPFARPIMQMHPSSWTIKEGDIDQVLSWAPTHDEGLTTLPGLQAVMGDPTTENIAKWVSRDMTDIMRENFEPEQIEMLTGIQVEVWETSSNMAAHGVML